jgi:hypothetical protein
MPSYRNISFAGNALQTANIITSDISNESLPEKVANMFSIGHSNGGKIPFTNYPSKIIAIAGTVIGSSVADLDAQLDTFRAFFRLDNQNLDIDYNAISRRYTATVNKVQIKRPGGLAYAEFSVEFLCTTPFGTNTTLTTAVTAAARTASTYTDTHTFLGNAPYQLPIATITLTTVSGSGNRIVYFGNAGTGQQVKVERAWVNGDVLVVNCITKTVSVNAVDVDFTGAFPEYAPGSQNLTVNDTFTSRTFNYLVQYYPAYF